ncbi:hypothetical protein [Rubrolithibacter danxiaensis]|uniref:hypothetical protein n=1 Tax=Rubrolithibacter danxiaensis TaxID=3390805 RepID=UPI003BF8BFCF
MQPQFGLVGVSLVIETIINILFCLALIRALKQVKPQNKVINEGSVWLYLIPVFNLFWLFKIVRDMAASLSNELLHRNYEVEEKPGYNIGFAAAIMPFITFAFMVFGQKQFTIQTLSLIIGVLGIIRLILFIQYWVKINWYRKVLENESKADTIEE